MARNPVAALDKLSEELLLQICWYIPGDITQLIKDEPNNTRSAYVARVQGLVNLAKTSKVFVPAAQEVLYQSAVLGDITQKSDTDSAMYDADRSPIIALVRTLIARPDLQRHLQVLQLIVPGPYAYKYYNRRDRGDTPLPRLTLRLPDLANFTAVINQAPFYNGITRIWRRSHEDRLPQSSCGVLLMLVQQLQFLSIATKWPDQTSKALSECFSINLHDSSVPVCLDDVPSLAGSKDLRISGTTPLVGASDLVALETVDVWSNQRALHMTHRDILTDSQSFPQVRTLILDCCVAGVDTVFSRWSWTWYTAFCNTLYCFPAVKHLHLLDVDKFPGAPWWPKYGMDMTSIVGLLAENYPNLVSLEMQDGLWECDAQVLSIHGFVEMESVVLPKKVVVMLAKGQMPLNLRRLEITNKDMSVDTKWKEELGGLGIEVVE